ncbi:MAG: ABC transporter substrate-binding protein [Marmoricola sp.]
MNVRRALLGIAAVGALVTITACGGPSSSGDNTTGNGASKGSITISGQNFPEATLVADMYQQLLEHDGYDVSTKLVATRDVYMGRFPSSVDIVPEYLAGIADFLNTQANGAKAAPVSSPDVSATLAAARKLADAKGITLLEPSKATDANAFFVTKKYADAHQLTDLSSLGKSGESVVLAAAPDCKGRTDCAGGLEKTYKIKISKVLPLGYASDQTYQSVLKGESQLGETSTTDGSLESQGLQLLDDDQHIQPAQNLLPAVSSAFLAKHPDVKKSLEGLMSVLTTDDLTQLNGQIGNERKKPEDVAKSYLQDKGLLD